MQGVKVSIDRVVVDFSNVYWDFFNPFRKWLCDFYYAKFYVKDKGFKYHIRVREGKYWVHISYQLVFARMARKHTLRLECSPDTLVHFRSWISRIVSNANEILLVRWEVAFDIPLRLSELFILSLTGRNMKKRKGRFYSNERYQRQVAGYCRVYDKRLELLQRQGITIEGELTRFEIVYKPDDKIPMDKLVQFPPEFSKLYLCAHATKLEQLKPKLLRQVQGMMHGELEQKDVTYYYRSQIKAEMRKRAILDFDILAKKQWEEAITITCAILGGVINKVPVA
ncbi:replication initiation factor family protein [Brevibacillus brevis]|uniref:replication initiation factor family protein n=1 Tax=Brevibacillus brevis TaxID=1393 RepID=UPI0037C58D92